MCPPKLVAMHNNTITTKEKNPETEALKISKLLSRSSQCTIIQPKRFEMIVLQVKNSVTVTTNTRQALDHPFCGDCFMNWGSFKQINRKMEKNGSRHPLNTWMKWESKVLCFQIIFFKTNKSINLKEAFLIISFHSKVIYFGI